MAQGDRTIFSKEIQIFTDQVQELEQAIYDTYLKRGITTAEGRTLDLVAENVNVVRPTGMSDEDFKAVILSQIEVNSSCGEPDRLINAVKYLSGTEIVSLYEFGRTVWIEFGGDGTNYDEVFRNTIKSIVAGGVELILIDLVGATPFLFDSDTNGFDNGTFTYLMGA